MQYQNTKTTTQTDTKAGDYLPDYVLFPTFSYGDIVIAIMLFMMFLVGLGLLSNTAEISKKLGKLAPKKDETKQP